MKKKNSFIFCFLILLSHASSGQIGLSYFFPENGYFSVPVAPFSYSQPLQIPGVRFLKFTPSAAIYSIGGMTVTGLPGGYGTSKPLMGPFHAITASFMPSVTIPVGSLDFDLGAGYFGSYNIAPRILRGNLDDMLARAEGWDVCSSRFTFDNNIAHGFVYGFTLTIWLNNDQAIAPGVIYYAGASDLNLRGEYSGGKVGQSIVTKTADFSKTKLNYRGFEAVIAVQF